jgi:hypothetical protein
MKAPSGKPTNLMERQWVQVRIPSFKRWFGDWENDPKNASKVVDENGEPKVVYHGSRTGNFAIFDNTHEDSKRKSDAPDRTAFFSSDKGVAYSYSGSRDKPPYAGEDYTPSIYEAFLSIRNPDVHHFEGADWQGDLYGVYEVYDVETGESVYPDNGSHYFENYDDALAAAESHRFSEDSIRADPWIGHSTNSVAKEAMREGYDGAIIYGVVDNGGYSDNAESDVYVVFEPEQIKSATDNTGMFDTGNPDIRFRRAARNYADVTGMPADG